MKLENWQNQLMKWLRKHKKNNKSWDFSNDLAHEIRNPLASLKSASELLDKTTEKTESEKLLKIINHDVEELKD